MEVFVAFQYLSFFDISYFSANLLKFVDGGWFAISVAVILSIIMVTWRDGRAILRKRFESPRCRWMS